MDIRETIPLVKSYLELGWSLIPILPESKKPAIKWAEYQERQATKEEVASWLKNGWWLAVVTGDISKICVVDDDRVKNNLEELQNITSPIIATTKSGGKHYYFRYDTEIHSHSNTKLHVDLKAWHSYVLLPPFNNRSWISAPTKERLNNLISLPSWVETSIRSDMEEDRPKIDPTEFVNISEGGRTTSIYQLACSIFNTYDYDTGKRILFGINQTYTPPLTEKELEYNINRAFAFVKANPQEVSVPVNLEFLKTVPPAIPDISGAAQADDTPLPIITVDEYKKLSFPKAQWLVQNLLRADGLNLVVGQSGVGKSLLCLSLIKSVAEGSPWLSKEFTTTPKRILIIDKENSETDLQNNLTDMGLSGDIRILQSAPFFNFVDNKMVLTPEAIKMKKYVEDNQIDIILLDSMIDFYIGSEDSSTDFNFNYQTWKAVFGSRCLLTIHHENKQPVKGKRNAKDRARGTTNIVAQANSIISVSSEEHRPELLTIEHTKVRGARKHQPFQIEMLTQTEQITNRSKVTGFAWKGNVEIKILMSDRAEEAILSFLSTAPDYDFTTEQIIENVTSSTEIGERNILDSLRKLRATNRVAFKGDGKRGNPYLHSYPKNIVDNALVNILKEQKNK